MKLDKKAFIEGFNAKCKEAGFVEDMKGVWEGIKTNTKDINPLRHPIDFLDKSYEGAISGFTGSALSKRLKPLEESGIAFAKDAFGIPKELDISQTIKNYGANLVGKLPQGVQDFLGKTKDFASRHTGSLLAGGLGLAGAYLLYKLLSKSDSNNSKARVVEPHWLAESAYAPTSVRALQKSGALLPTALSLPYAIHSITGASKPAEDAELANKKALLTLLYHNPELLDKLKNYSRNV